MVVSVNTRNGTLVWVSYVAFPRVFTSLALIACNVIIIVGTLVL